MEGWRHVEEVEKQTEEYNICMERGGKRTAQDRGEEIKLLSPKGRTYDRRSEPLKKERAVIEQIHIPNNKLFPRLFGPAAPLRGQFPDSTMRSAPPGGG